MHTIKEKVFQVFYFGRIRIPMRLAMTIPIRRMFQLCRQSRRTFFFPPQESVSEGNNFSKKKRHSFVFYRDSVERLAWYISLLFYVILALYGLVEVLKLQFKTASRNQQFLYPRLKCTDRFTNGNSIKVK